MRGLLRGRWEKVSKDLPQPGASGDSSKSDLKNLQDLPEEKGSHFAVHSDSAELPRGGGVSSPPQALESKPKKSESEPQNLISPDGSLQFETAESSRKMSSEERFEEEDLKNSPKGPKVLILDDDNQILEIVSSIVESVGGIPLKALNGHQAMNLLDYEDIQLVILDLHMPEMNGVSFLKGVRRLGAIPNAIVYVLTGRPDTDVLEELKPLGVQGCIVKPFHPDELKETIINHLVFSDQEVPC